MLPTWNFVEIKTPVQIFFSEFSEIFEDTFFRENIQAIASDLWKLQVQTFNSKQICLLAQ